MRVRAFAIVAMLTATLAAQDVAALVDQLGSSDGNARAQAYNQLQQLRSPDAVPLLQKKVASFPLQGQQYAVWILQQQPIEQTRAVWQKLVTADSALLRAAAAAQLWRHGERAHAAVLANALTSAAPEERQQLLNFVFGIADASVLAAIRGYVAAGQPPQLVLSALQHLVQQEPARSEPTIAAAEALIEAEQPTARAAALAYLVAAGNGARAPLLATVLREHPELFGQVRVFLDRAPKLDAVLLDAVAAALAAAKNKFELEQLAPLLQRNSPDRAAATLKQLLGATDDELRAAAMATLAAIPGALDPKALRAMLASDSAPQQLVAAAVLRRMDDPSGLPTVLTALPKMKGKDRQEAARVLGAFRVRGAVPPLLDLLDDADQTVRQHAWNGLQDLLRDLFPYRRFDFAKSGYDPNAADRTAGIATLRAWWAAVPANG